MHNGYINSNNEIFVIQTAMLDMWLKKWKRKKNGEKWRDNMSFTKITFCDNKM